MHRSLLTLIRIDAIAGIAAGLLLYFGRSLWAPWSGLSVGWFAALGIVGVCYGLYSGTIAISRPRQAWPVYLLVTANVSYALFCFGLLVMKWNELSRLGAVHLLAEVVFVGGLALLEARAIRPRSNSFEQR